MTPAGGGVFKRPRGLAGASPLAVALGLAVAAGAAGAAADSAASGGRCADPGTQAEMNECAGAAYEKADAELNALSKEFGRRLSGDPATMRLLAAAQRAWIGFRDAECAFTTSEVAQGTAYPTLRAACLEGLTQARLKDFRRYLGCAEGDLSCPVPAK